MSKSLNFLVHLSLVLVAVLAGIQIFRVVAQEEQQQSDSSYAYFGHPLNQIESFDTDQIPEGESNLYFKLGTDGKIPSQYLPQIPVTSVNVVPDQAAMIALEANTGSVAIVQSENQSYILATEPASEINNWFQISNPLEPSVLSVNGSIGAVSLDTDDVSEGTSNLYFNDEKARQALSANSPILYDQATGIFSLDIDGLTSLLNLNTFMSKAASIYDTQSETLTTSEAVVLDGNLSLTPSLVTNDVLITIFINLEVQGQNLEHNTFRIRRGSNCSAPQVGEDIIVTTGAANTSQSVSYSTTDSPMTDSLQTYTVCGLTDVTPNANMVSTINMTLLEIVQQ